MLVLFSSDHFTRLGPTWQGPEEICANRSPQLTFTGGSKVDHRRPVPDAPNQRLLRNLSIARLQLAAQWRRLDGARSTKPARAGRTLAMILRLLLLAASCFVAATAEAAQDYIETDGLLSDDDFYRLVACAAPPGGDCTKRFLRWSSDEPLHVQIAGVDRAFLGGKQKRARGFDPRSTIHQRCRQCAKSRTSPSRFTCGHPDTLCRYRWKSTAAEHRNRRCGWHNCHGRTRDRLV